MGNFLKIIAIVMVFLVAMYLVAKFTVMFETYRLPTSSMAPAYPLGKIIYSSRLLTPDYGDIICFKTRQPNNNDAGKVNEEIRMYRLIAKEGDTIQIKKGFAFVNGVQIDKDLPLLFLYKSDEVNANPELFSMLPKHAINPAGPYLFLYLTEKQFHDLSSKIAIEKVEFPGNNFQDNPVWKQIVDPSWNSSNFGPVVVPNDHVFVLGDNRDNAADSRVIGFVPTKDIISTVFFPKS